MIRVAAYCRVSTDKEDQANSFEAQCRYFREYIDREPDWTLQRIYADEGLSGTGTAKRVQFNAMIHGAKKGEIDLIITKEISRFARNTLDALEYTRALRKMGVGVLFLLDRLNTLETDGELRLTIMASIAQEESRRTSERVKFGQMRSMEKGVVFGGSLLGYDVEHGKLYINPDGAKVVRTVFHKYLYERKSVAVIAEELNAQRIPTSRGNFCWSGATVLKILKNEKYCGDLIQKKTYTPDFLTHEKRQNKGTEPLVILRNHHEGIVDRAVWDEVQQQLLQRRRGGQRIYCGTRYPLSGKVWCGCCGSGFLPRRKRRKDGSVYIVWRCGKAAAEGKGRIDENGTAVGCSVGRQLREDAAMKILKQAVGLVRLAKAKMSNDLLEIISSVLMERTHGEEQHLGRELEGERKKKQRALDELLAGTISREEFKAVTMECSQTIERIANRIAGIEHERKTETRMAGIRSALYEILMDEMGDDSFYCHLLRNIKVFGDGRVEVVLHSLKTQIWADKTGCVAAHDLL